ncbi:MAG: FecR family protein [Flavobacteriaceae bacterium]|nr:FecR family protein [Flavobacteriaceae bacterium]
MKDLIIDYLNNTISKDDLETLKNWLKQAKNKKEFEAFVQLNYELHLHYGLVDIEEASKKVMAEIQQRTLPKSNPFKRLIKYASIFVGVCIVGYGAYKSFSNFNAINNDPQITLQLQDGSIKVIEDSDTSTKIIVDASGNTVTEQKNKALNYTTQINVEELSYNTLTVPYGKTFTVVLSDGSKVTLNAGTALTYPVSFIENEIHREVFLDGEAYFQVAKDSKHPFIVNTNDMDVEVLGTQFNISAYSDDEKSYTVLVEGKVAAHNKLTQNNTKILTPNQLVYQQDKQFVVETVNIQKYVAWVNGELVFIDDSFKVITNKLERKYNLKINNTYPELNDINITATFSNENIDQVLKTFQTYKPFNYQIKNGVVTIVKPKTN